MIGSILRKDVRLLWPLVAVVAGIQAGFEWASFKTGLPGANAVAGDLLRPLALAWNFGIVALAVAAVQEDPLPGVDEDWLIRPIPRTGLLLSKLIFILVAVALPMLLLNVAHAVAMGFPLGSSFAHALGKELYVFLCLVVPAMALAALTRNLAQLVLLAAALVLAWALGLVVSSALLGLDRCPTCNTGLSWLQHLLQHGVVLAGAIVILILQYYRRRTHLARILAVAGTSALAFVQLPWSSAFAMQQRLAVRADAPNAVSIVIGGEAQPTARLGGEPLPTEAAHRATRAFLRGDVDSVAEGLGQLARGSAEMVAVALPQRVTGLAPDQVLLIDRSEVFLADGAGRILYRHSNAAQAPGPFLVSPPDATVTGDAPDLIDQSVLLPLSAYTQARASRGTLQLSYSLTLMGLAVQYRMSALEGRLRTPALGLCRSTAERTLVRLRCQQLGNAPSCFSATLYAADGRHNPTEWACTPDYRTHVPDPQQILSFAGLELPIHDPAGLARYAVEASGLPGAQLALRIYAPLRHFSQLSRLSAPSADVRPE